MISFGCLIEPLENATLILRTVNNRGHFKSSPTMFSFIISQISPLCTVALQIMPRYFTQYSCDRTHYYDISVDQIYRTLNNLKPVGFCITNFSLDEVENHIRFVFHGYERESVWAPIPVWVPFEEENVGKINYSSFALIDIEEFTRIVTELDGAKAGVTITDSQISFCTATKQTILLNKGKHCIIGGVAVGREIQFTISLYPLNSFSYSIISKWVWLFRPYDSNGGIILVAPIALYAQISTYFPAHLATFWKTLNIH